MNQWLTKLHNYLLLVPPTPPRGRCIRTFTGRLVNPLCLKPEDVDIQDIAHALSNMCRFNGHVRRFYSVAEHCIRVASLVPPEQAFEGLMHDRSETYLPDMTRPVKYSPEMAFFREVEAQVDSVTAIPFGISASKTPEIDIIDKVLCAIEQRDLMNGAVAKPELLAHPAVQDYRIDFPMYPTEAERNFLQWYYELRPTWA